MGNTLNSSITVAWVSPVPKNLRVAIAHCVASVIRKAGFPNSSLLVVVFPCDTYGAFVAHRDASAIPLQVRNIAAKANARYIVIAPTALLSWGPELVEAVLAHELGHIVLGHCDKQLHWFMARCRHLFPVRLLLLKKEMDADRYAARLGYAESLREVLRRLLRQKWSLPGAVRLWLLRRG